MSRWRKLLMVLAAAIGALWSSTPSAATVRQLDAHPAVSPEDLPVHHRRWLEREVVWLITDLERDVFLRLGDDDRREAFIAEFWRQRDPSPGTRHNEFRHAVEQRVHEADRRFSRGSPTPGWLTDRGRIFILLGEPQSVLDLPNTQFAVPLQLWTYAVDPDTGLPPFFYVIFYKPRGFGDYRLYGPVSDGPEELLNEAGRAMGRGAVASGELDRIGGPTGFGDLSGMLAALADVDRELARAAINLIPGSGAGGGSAPLQSELLLARIEDLPRRIMPSPDWAVRFLTGAAETAVRYETLPLQATAVGLLDPEGVPFVHLMVEAPAARLNLQQREPGGYLTFERTVSLFDSGGRALGGPLADSVEIGFDAGTASDLRRAELLYLDRLPAVAGDLTVALMVENPVSREFGQAEIAVRVPGPGGETLAASPPLLVFQHEDLGAAYDPFGPHTAFQLGRNFVLPLFEGPFPTGSEMWVFHQIYSTGESLPPVAASYRLVDDAGRVWAEREITLPLERRDRHGTLNQLTGLDPGDAPPGDYTVRVEIPELAGYAFDLPLILAPAARATAPLVHAPLRPPPTDPAVMLRRARALRAVGSSESAAELAREVLDRDPGSEEALQLTVGVLLDLGRPEEALELLAPRVAEQPDRTDLLVAAAEAAASAGNHWDAIRYYERARRNGAQDTPELLNALAGEYLADGDVERARALLERSLALDADQDAVRAMLVRIRG